MTAHRQYRCPPFEFLGTQPPGHAAQVFQSVAADSSSRFFDLPAHQEDQVAPAASLHQVQPQVQVRKRKKQDYVWDVYKEYNKFKGEPIAQGDGDTLKPLRLRPRLRLQGFPATVNAMKRWRAWAAPRLAEHLLTSPPAE